LQLVIDRREDPVTPLLSQWTYQAMVHELLPKGISNNIVDLKGVPGVSKDLQEVVLSPSSDDFFRQQMFANYGDLGGAVRKLLDDYSKSRGSHESEYKRHN
jgi:vacuolar protein sorting-associated protein 45